MLGIILTFALPVTATTSTSFTTPSVIERSLEAKTEVTEEQLIVNKIKEVFGKDADAMIKIARCESGLKQFDDKGNVVIGTITPDIGLFQISLSHKKEWEKLGLDPTKLDDNVTYAKILFDSSGTDPWLASKKCWSK